MELPNGFHQEVIESRENARKKFSDIIAIQVLGEELVG